MVWYQTKEKKLKKKRNRKTLCSCRERVSSPSHASASYKGTPTRMV